MQSSIKIAIYKEKSKHLKDAKKLYKGVGYLYNRHREYYVINA